MTSSANAGDNFVTKLYLAIAAVVMTFVAPAIGQEPAPQSEAAPESTTATFLMTGLHCPPCTRTVESSLAGVAGILAIKVDWKTKMAVVEFDETVLSAQGISQLIAATPHMMGRSLHYGGWLALRAPEIKDEASGEQAEKALLAVEGVKSAKSYPAQHAVAVYFASKGELTTQQLIEALSNAGFQAENY
jgi:copper chaperone CopZ